MWLVFFALICFDDFQMQFLVTAVTACCNTAALDIENKGLTRSRVVQKELLTEPIKIMGKVTFY